DRRAGRTMPGLDESREPCPAVRHPRPNEGPRDSRDAASGWSHPPAPPRDPEGDGPIATIPLQILPEALLVTSLDRPTYAKLGPMLLALLCGFGRGPVVATAAPPSAVPAKVPGKAAVAPAAPVVPGEIVAALQEGKYDVARAGLRELEGKATD